MEDWEGAHEEMKAEIHQLKDQIGQILEALKGLSIDKSPAIESKEGTSSYWWWIDPNQGWSHMLKKSKHV